MARRRNAKPHQLPSRGKGFLTMRKMFLAAVLLAAPASAAERYTMIAGSFAMSGGPRPVIVAMSVPQIAPDYATAKACATAAVFYKNSGAFSLGEAANILGDGVPYTATAIATCEPSSPSLVPNTPGGTMQYNVGTGIGNLANGSNGNVLSLTARTESAAACRQAIIDVRAALADVVAMLPIHVGDGFCY